MTLADLALVALAGILGPVLAWRREWDLPIVLGELVAGFVLGQTGLRLLHAADPTFTFLSDIGFALVMFVAGTHVPVRDASLRRGLRTGLLRAALVGLVAVGAGTGIAALFGTGHAALYSVLLASSSAALVLPVVDSLSLGGPSVLQLLSQVAVADTLCIVALPLAIDPARAGRAALGGLAVVVCAGVAFVVLRHAERNGLRKRLHRISENRNFALELRVNLVLLFALAALAVSTHVSIMLAGFSFGIAIAAIGEPRRLARQLFAITEGFFAPLFFVWLGASINLRELGTHPSFILLGVVLGVAACLVHLVPRALGQPIPLGLMAAAQLGVPVAAATIGGQSGILKPGEPAALILGALVTITAATFGGARAGRSPRFRAASAPSAGPGTGAAGPVAPDTSGHAGPSPQR
jgi:Kef-type K+ transport system membrane component KefB